MGELLTLSALLLGMTRPLLLSTLPPQSLNLNNQFNLLFLILRTWAYVVTALILSLPTTVPFSPTLTTISLNRTEIQLEFNINILLVQLELGVEDMEEIELYAKFATNLVVWLCSAIIGTILHITFTISLLRYTILPIFLLLHQTILYQLGLSMVLSHYQSIPQLLQMLILLDFTHMISLHRCHQPTHNLHHHNVALPLHPLTT